MKFPSSKKIPPKLQLRPDPKGASWQALLMQALEDPTIPKKSAGFVKAALKGSEEG